MTGGDGADVLDLTGEVAGMTISLNNIGDDGPLGSSANVLGIETVMGTLSDDILSGGDGADTLDGRDGNDRIDARGGGADTVICGPGAADVAIVDETDSVTGCEQVELPAAPTAARPTPARSIRPRPPWSTSTATASWPASTATTRRAAIRPGARDVPGNKIDEDCAGGDARASQVGGRLSFDFTAFPNGTTRVDRLDRPRAPGRRARRAALQRAAARSARRSARPTATASVNLRKLIRGRLRTGATLEVRLYGPRHDRPRGPLQDAQGQAAQADEPVPAARRAGGALRVRRAGA